MWEIVSSIGLGHKWPTPNIKVRGEGERKKTDNLEYINISLENI